MKYDSAKVDMLLAEMARCAKELENLRKNFEASVKSKQQPKAA